MSFLLFLIKQSRSLPAVVYLNPYLASGIYPLSNGPLSY